MERLDLIAYNGASERRNTVQPQAVNLAYAEPCQDQRSRYGSFHFWAVLARIVRRGCGKAGYPQMTQVLKFKEERRRVQRPRLWVREFGNLGAEGSHRGQVSSNVKRVRTPTQSRGRGTQTAGSNTSKPKQAPARLYARTAPGAGPRPCRRCAIVQGAQHFLKSAHLGKCRRFLRRCAPFCKVRTENCAPSKGDGLGHRFRPACAFCDMRCDAKLLERSAARLWPPLDLKVFL